MNKFEIKIIEAVSESGTRFHEIRLIIDGRDLIDMLKEHEMAFVKCKGDEIIAGNYSGLSAAHTPSGRFFGECDNDYGEHEEKVALLGCKCGIEACWPFAVKIIITDKSVIWTDFEQPHRSRQSAGGFWDYSGFAPLEFDLKEYQDEVSKLAKYAQSR